MQNRIVINRLQRKCVIASAGLHLLLGVILIFGPAFVARDRNPDHLGKPSSQNDLPAVQLINLPPEALPASQPQPEHTTQPLVANDKSEPKQALQKLGTSRGLKAPKVTTNPVARNHPPSAGSHQTRDSRLEQFEQLVKDFQKGRSSVTTIETGSALAGKEDIYAQFVRDTYTAKWDLTEADPKSDDAVTKVTVTIGSDGKVLSSGIVGSSGDAQVDQTVKRTLDRVTFIRPFGEGAKEKQRTYTINFSLRAKRF